MPRDRQLTKFFPISRLILCVIGVFLVSFVCTENLTSSGKVVKENESSYLTNSSANMINLKHENPEKFQSPPPLVDVFHGKVNSVAHDLLGSMDDMPSLVREVLTTDNVPSHTEYNTVKSILAEDNVTGVESLLDPVLLATLPTLTNRNDSTTIVPPSEGILPAVDTPSPAIIKESGDIEPSSRLPPAAEPSKILHDPLIIQKPPQDELASKVNDTEGHHDDIPSFSEWANKKMAEVEKSKGENHTVGTTKIRLKNYASPDCGAKVVAANPEAVSAGAVLSPSRDDYMLNPCNVKIWFVVELCETIQPQRVEIANFELFSSSPQDLSIWVSDRYPTREWSQVATVQAKDERTVQSFPLPRLSHFAKYVKVELHSHYGSEHYCPVSLFKAYGTSELEVLDNDPADNDPDDDSIQSKQSFEEDDESVLKISDPYDGSSNKDRKKPGDDLFRTAKEAVLSIVQKAAQVLGNGGARNNSCLNVTTSSQCLTPGYQIVCNNCTDQFYYRLYEVMCCNGKKLKELLSNKFINTIVAESPLCSSIGINFSSEVDNSSESTSSTHAIGMSYLRALLGDDTLAALCNYLAVSRRKTALNISQDKGKVEDVPPSVQLSPEVTVQEATTSQASVTPPAAVDIEPTSSKVEPPISISPTKTLPVLIDNPEVVNGTAVTDEAPAEVLNRQEPGSSTETPNITLPSDLGFITTETQPPNLDTAPEGVVEPVPSPPIETIQQPPPTQEEPVSMDPIGLESLFPEESEEESPPQDTTAKPTTVTTPVQKESVFVRLANRIKALEVNMSLSSQYLEELSRRYKKQVEELQRTLAGMVEERRLASERENAQSAQIALLTQKTEALTAAVTQLLEERSQWGPKFYAFGQHGVIMFIVLFLVLGMCRWLMSQGKTSDLNVRPPLPQRRHSLDGPPAANNVQTKKRRPSEEALIPSSRTHQELLIEGAKRKTSRDGKQKRKRRRKDKLEDGLSIVSADNEELITTPPEYIRTADWSRKQRTSIQTQTSSSQETLGSLAPPSSANSSIKKKTGALKKIMNKLF